MDDLEWLRTSGLEAMILKKSSQGVPVIGICGGFQMLGESLKILTMWEHGGWSF